VPLPEGASSDGKGGLPIMMIDDAKYVAVYTSEEQFERCAGKYSAAVTPGRAFARTLPPDIGLAVNPGGEGGLPIFPAGVQVIRGEETAAGAGTQITLGEPAEEPYALLEALREAFAAGSEVASARRAWAKVGDSLDGLLLGIEIKTDDDQSRRSALQAVATALGGSPVPYTVNSVFLSDDRDPVVGWFLENTQPFYVRSA